MTFQDPPWPSMTLHDLRRPSTTFPHGILTSMRPTGRVQGFPMAVLTHDTTEGKAYAIQCAGLGPLTPNTVMMGWPWWWKSQPEKYVPEFLSTIHQATLRQKALLVCHNVKDFPTNDEPQSGFIDVWWIKHDGAPLISADLTTPPIDPP